MAFLRGRRSKGSKNKFQQLKNLTYKILNELLQSRSPHRFALRGVAFAFSGRVYGAKKASSFKQLFGSVPFGSYGAKIDYGAVVHQTRNGT